MVTGNFYNPMFSIVNNSNAFTTIKTINSNYGSNSLYGIQQKSSSSGNYIIVVNNDNSVSISSDAGLTWSLADISGNEFNGLWQKLDYK